MRLFIIPELFNFVVLNEKKTWLLAKSVTERLIQRLLCGAGMLDPRFSSKYLICDTNQSSNNVSNKLEYMIRLDCLSTPSLYESDIRPKYSIIETDSDYPAAYARMRLHTSAFKIWGDYTNSNGYLRRDKVQARLVELLALAATKDVPSSPLHVDESVCCGVPGKVVDSASLYSILHIPPHQHVYYGPGGNVPRFPDPRDFRLAIVDEPKGIRIRVEFLSPALSSISLDVRLLVAIGIDAWPSSTDFPSRICLGHSDCLLYHQAAQTGMYLVGYGVQSSAWQIRMPAAEYVLLNHYGPNSTTLTVLDVLYSIMDDIDNSRRIGKQQISYKILSKYIFRTLLLEELEQNSRSPLTNMLNWSPIYLSTHVLKLLDRVIPRLHAEKQPNYFFGNANLMVNPGHLSDDDFTIEANNVRGNDGNEEFNMDVLAQESEINLLHKWKDIVDGLLPPAGTRGRRFCFAGSKNKLEIAHTQYTISQLEYIGLLLNKMLNVRQHVLQGDTTMTDDQLRVEELEHENPLEDLIFILVTIMDQARDRYLFTQTNPAIVKNAPKIKCSYNTYTSKLVEQMRRDNELQNFNFDDDLVLVKVILKWLYRAMDQNKRYLGPILRPYLNNLFATSHAVSWHMDFIKDRMKNDEIESLGAFAELVNSDRVTPAQGLVDFVNRDKTWARSMLSMVEKNTLRVVFVSDRGIVHRHILSLPPQQTKNNQNGSKTLESPKVKKETREQKTLPSRNYFNTILKGRIDEEEDITPQHNSLRNASPLNLILSKRHRRGEHRGGGDIFEALKSMQKLNTFQEVASNLPQEDRAQISDLIQSIHTAKSKRYHAKKWSETIPQLNYRNKLSPNCEAIQKYTPKEESAGIRLREDTEAKFQLKDAISTPSLIGSCRAARIREDNSVFLLQDSFRIRSMLTKNESFKY
ncbi:hypothetical protein NQ318_004813 [Aromia moschata]|uniref:Uncharacterized protein n=1 Tax=Aromia moschata TaxID=1265417 RepID=A0AAV8Z016_9CUCU|nr:hypothetical protein NQ318_004813 [Aromia moschata]